MDAAGLLPDDCFSEEIMEGIENDQVLSQTEHLIILQKEQVFPKTEDFHIIANDQVLSQTEDLIIPNDQVLSQTEDLDVIRNDQALSQTEEINIITNDQVLTITEDHNSIPNDQVFTKIGLNILTNVQVLSQTEDVNITTNDHVLSQTEDVNIIQNDQVLSQTEDVNITTNDPVLSQTEDVNITTNDQVVTQTEDLNITTNDPVLSQTEDVNITTNDQVLSQTEYVNIIPNDQVLSQTEDVNIIPNDQVVTQTEDLNITTNDQVLKQTEDIKFKPTRVNNLVAFFSQDKKNDYRSPVIPEQNEEPFDSMSPKYYGANPEPLLQFAHDTIDLSGKKETDGYLDEVSGVYDASESVQSECQVNEDLKVVGAADVVAKVESVASVNSSVAHVPEAVVSQTTSVRSVSENAVSAKASLSSVTGPPREKTKAASGTPSQASVVKSAVIVGSADSLASVAKSAASVGPMVSDRACNTEDDLVQPTESEVSEYDEGLTQQKNLQSMASKLAGCIAAVKKQELKVQNETKEYKQLEKQYIKSKQKLKLEETKLKNLKEKGKRQAHKLTSVVSTIKALE